MKIVFLCGALEPGRDGVGDYVRRLAGWLIGQGHSVSGIALNDHFVKEEISQQQFSEGAGIEMLRLPSAWTANKRFEKAKEVIQVLNPDWISLQFVIFAFDPRGIPFSLPGQLKKIIQNRRWHIMFHELWLGEARQDAFKDKIRGWLQRRIIRRLLADPRPAVVSTSTSFFQQCLQSAGIETVKIPVFSNLPPGNPNGKKLYHYLPVHVQNKREDYIIAAFFGNVTEDPGLGAKINILETLTGNAGKKLLITHAGRSSNIEQLFSSLQTTTNASFLVLGQQPEQDIADYFKQVDIGLSTYPEILYEKSGAIASMLYNNLPVVLLRDSFIRDTRVKHEIKNVEDITNISTFIQQNNHKRQAVAVPAFETYNQLFSQSKQSPQ